MSTSTFIIVLLSTLVVLLGIAFTVVTVIALLMFWAIHEFARAFGEIISRR